MIKKQPVKKNKRKKIKFLFYAPEAREVILMGDFNKWNAKKHRMKKGGQGTWEKALILTPGTYEYKYLVDGDWKEDPESNENRLNSFGTYNNLLTVAG